MANINAPAFIILYLEAADYVWKTKKLLTLKTMTYFAYVVELQVKRSPTVNAYAVDIENLQ